MKEGEQEKGKEEGPDSNDVIKLPPRPAPPSEVTKMGREAGGGIVLRRSKMKLANWEDEEVEDDTAR